MLKQSCFHKRLEFYSPMVEKKRQQYRFKCLRISLQHLESLEVKEGEPAGTVIGVAAAAGTALIVPVSVSPFCVFYCFSCQSTWMAASASTAAVDREQQEELQHS